MKVRTETREISDADSPPKSCPHCQSTDFTRVSYYFRTLQEMGSPAIARRIRYEAITWECNACHASFAIHNPLVPMRSAYMPEIIEYATHRVLNKGDSARRVGEDLRILHQVEISEDTILGWINKKTNPEKSSPASSPVKSFPTEFSEKEIDTEFSGVMGIDGTFKAVKAKKNEPPRDGRELHLLHLTHLEDGRLVAYWHAEKPKKK